MIVTFYFNFSNGFQLVLKISCLENSVELERLSLFLKCKIPRIEHKMSQTANPPGPYGCGTNPASFEATPTDPPDGGSHYNDPNSNISLGIN